MSSLHVAQVRHRDAHLADLAGGLGRVGVIAGLGGRSKAMERPVWPLARLLR